MHYKGHCQSRDEFIHTCVPVLISAHMHQLIHWLTKVSVRLKTLIYHYMSCSKCVYYPGDLIIVYFHLYFSYFCSFWTFLYFLFKNRSWLTLTKNTNGIIKGHGFDVERCKNSFFVCQCWIIIARDLCWQYDTHIAEINIHSPKICSTQWWTLSNKTNISVVFNTLVHS